MLRVYFLNVGHGDSTLIEHPSGRLTMIDINNSQDYDSDSFQEVLAERREKERARRFAATLTGLGGDPHTGFAGLGNPFATVLVQPALPTDNILLEVLEAIETTRKEITDPVKFLQKYYPGRRLWRFILSHPDLDHMRGIKRLHQTIGFDNFWDTANTKPTPTFKGESDKEDWFYYQQLRAGGTGFKHNFTRGDRFYAFNANADGTLEGFPADLNRWDSQEVRGERFYWH